MQHDRETDQQITATGYDGPICAQHGEVDSCGPTRVRTCGARFFENGKPCLAPRHDDSRRCHAHRDTACYCCGEVDDPDGKGPAINTGFCAECNAAGCPGTKTSSQCSAMTCDCKPPCKDSADQMRSGCKGAWYPHRASTAIGAPEGLPR